MEKEIDIHDKSDETEDSTQEIEDSTQVEVENNQQEDNIKAFLDDFDLSSLDEARKQIEKIQKITGKIGDSDIEQALDQLIERNKKLEEIEAAWALEEEKKQREKETPEQRIARLEKERNELKEKLEQRENKQKQQETAKALINSFDSIVVKTINTKKVPQVISNFAQKWFRGDSPVASVAIDDKTAIKKMVETGIKDLETLADNIIQAYVDGKMKIPKTGKTSSTAGITNTGKKTIKTEKLIDAAIERLKAAGFK